MSEEDEKIEGEGKNEAEQPEIFAVERNGKKNKFNRRDFLLTAGVGASAVGLIGAGINVVRSSDPSKQAMQDSPEAVKLEITALSFVLAQTGKDLIHSWRIANKGTTDCPATVLHLVLKEDPNLQKAVQIPAVASGQSVDVPVKLDLPEATGKYTYRWQLKLGEGAATMRNIEIDLKAAALAESSHPYSNSYDNTWTINNPDSSAIHSSIHFSRVEVEDNYDYVHIQNGSGNVVQTITGDYPSGFWSTVVYDNVVKVRLVSDSSVNAWGFQVDAIQSTFYFVYLPMISRPQPTPTSYVTCSCNTVELCTCNLVCVCEAVCSCDGYCSCDSQCSCDGNCSCNEVCTCNTIHYWYPN